MFKTSTSILIGVLAVLIGTIVIICNTIIGAQQIVLAGGLMFIVAGILNYLMTMLVKDHDGTRKAKGAPMVFNIIASAAAVAFGVCMLVMNSDFQKLMPIVFAILILFGSLMLFYIIGFGCRDKQSAKWLFIFPVTVLIGAITVYLLDSPANDPLIMIFTGISIIVYGLGIALTAATIAYKNRHKAPTHVPAPTVQEPQEPATAPDDTTLHGLK